MYAVSCKHFGSTVPIGWWRWLAMGLASLLAVASAHAGMGLMALASQGAQPPVTVLYPTDAAQSQQRRAGYEFLAAPDAQPSAGVGRLVVLSHGSGGGPWTYLDVARTLVAAGFTVAVPLHEGDNVSDPGQPGPPSWRKRPQEVSRAIDAIAADSRFAHLLPLKQVGVYGMSAGGHTALSLAGGRWSEARLKQHCQSHLREDFQACVGLSTQLRGNWLDSVKLWVAQRVIDWKLSSEQWHEHHEPRIAAAVAGVPYSADFDLASLRQPRVPLGIISCGQDRWLLPRFHSGQVLSVCTGCEHLADLPEAGHGALLSPMPTSLKGLVAKLLEDPVNFDRTKLNAVHQAIAQFMLRHLLAPVLSQSGQNPP